jgi:hypothetical protein
MKPKSPALMILLTEIRQHPAFPELLAAVEAPKLPMFKPRKNGAVEQAQANWIFESGRLRNHLAWMEFLTGTELPPDRVDDLSSAEKE